MKIGAIPENFLERLLMLAGFVPTPVIDTFHAVIVARAIIVATKLGIFDGLASSPLSAKEAAIQLDVNAPALEKLLNILVATRYLWFRHDRYYLTQLSRKWLVADSPQSLHDNMLLRFLEWEAIEATEEFVRTGNAIDVHGQLREDQWRVYQRGMRSLARLTAREVVRRVRLPANPTAMLDVGGGHGTYSVSFCRHYPQLRATILDLPSAVEAAAPILAEEGMRERVLHRPGDILTEHLGKDRWDLVFVSHLVHHFDEAANIGLICRAARSLRPNGILAILEVLRPASPNAASQTGALLDLYFAITSHAGTWSYGDITRWFKQAGLHPGRPISLRSAPGITVLTAAAGQPEVMLTTGHPPL